MELIKNDSDIDLLPLKMLNPEEEQNINNILKSQNLNFLTNFNCLKHYNDIYKILIDDIKNIDQKIINLNNNKIQIEAKNNPLQFNTLFLDNLYQHLKPLNIIPQWNNENLLNCISFYKTLNKYTTDNYIFTPEKVNKLLLWISLPIKDILALPNNNWSKTILQHWYKNTNTNAIIIKDLLINMCKYEISNNSLINYYLVKEHNNLVIKINNIKNNIFEYFQALNYNIIQNNCVMEYGFDFLIQTIPEYRFDLVTDTKIENNMLSLLFEIIITNETKCLNEFLDKNLSQRSLICSCVNILKQIKINGWEYFVKIMLLHKGVGMKTVNFDYGIHIGIEPICIYYFKEWINRNESDFSNLTKYYDVNSLIEIAEQKKFYNLIDLIKIHFDL